MAEWPWVECLCPTYGRFERLRDALACFLLQDYPGPARLLILNDAPEALNLTPHWAGQAEQQALLTVRPARSVLVLNVSRRYETLGHKRQALLEAATAPLVAHWDDDDLYLPWHLKNAVTRLRRAGKACAKARAAWWMLGPREGPWQVKGPCHNVFEGQMVFDRQAALRLGGYALTHSGQVKALLDAFRRAGLLVEWEPEAAEISYAYRWADGADHVSARKGQTRDRDFGAGRPLLPAEALADARTWAAARLQAPFNALATPRGCAVLEAP